MTVGCLFQNPPPSSRLNKQRQSRDLCSGQMWNNVCQLLMVPGLFVKNQTKKKMNGLFVHPVCSDTNHAGVLPLQHLAGWTKDDD